MNVQQILEKRTFDDRLYTIDCSALLAVGQTITSIGGITDDSAELTFTNAVINLAPITLASGRIIPIRQGIQIEVSGGALGGALSQLLTIRASFATNTDPAVEATVQLFLCDTPGVLPNTGCC